MTFEFSDTFALQPPSPHSRELWVGRIGTRADIVNGEIVPSETGFLTVSESPLPYTVYVDSAHTEVTPVIPVDDLRGRAYKFKNSDCAYLVALWLDANTGAQAVAYIRGMTRAFYADLNINGFEHALTPLGFSQVDDAPKHGDILFYMQDRHIGVCIDGDKILHHIPLKYSSLDVIDPTLVLKVFRHGV